MRFIFRNEEQSFAIQFNRKEFALAQELMTCIVFDPESVEVGIKVIEHLEKCQAEDVPTKKKPHLKLV